MGSLRDLLNQPDPSWGEDMTTAVHCAVARGKMPAGRLSDLIGWMHGRIKAHQESNRRWVEANPDKRSLSDAVRYKATKPRRELTPEERRERAARYMRNYRANLRREQEEMVRQVEDGTIMRRAAMEHWRQQKKWYRRNRRRLMREGKWTGYPPKPEGLTKPKKPTA